MLKFGAYRNGQPVGDVELGGAYAFGQDTIPIRADLSSTAGTVTAVKRVPGAAGLALLWDASPAGRYMLPTTRLPESNDPYNLNVELARSLMMRLSQKIEDWGLFDFPDAQPLLTELDALRKLFIESLKARGAEASRFADRVLAEGITLGERLALFHADIFLGRRRVAVGRASFGCVADVLSSPETYQDLVRDAFDYVTLPMPWRHTEPKERLYQYTQTDAWVNWAARARKRVHAGPLLSFQPAYLPEWLYIFEHDYDTLRTMIYEHIQRIVRRYERHARVWIVTSGIHAYNGFNLSFEQLMELTRMSCLLVKKLAPQSQVVIELSTPWGEYYARNQRTIPPLLYADMCVQSGVKFDAFGVQVHLGAPQDGYYVRDLLQISGLLDEFVLLGKPLHISACQVPSDIVPDKWDNWGGKLSAAAAGQWHADWSQRLQAEWLQAFLRIAISKPGVESICWRDLADYEGHFIPHGGLCRANAEPKLAYRELRAFRASLATRPQEPKEPPGGPTTGTNPA